MAILEIADVNDDDRRRIIDVYRAKPILWCPDVTKDREKMSAAWENIAEIATQPNRTFTVPLVKKVWKNLRDQYVKTLKADPAKSTWQFKSALSFLGTELASKPKAGSTNGTPLKKAAVKKEPKPKKSPKKKKSAAKQEHPATPTFPPFPSAFIPPTTDVIPTQPKVEPAMMIPPPPMAQNFIPTSPPHNNIANSSMVEELNEQWGTPEQTKPSSSSGSENIPGQLLIDENAEQSQMTDSAMSDSWNLSTAHTTNTLAQVARPVKLEDVKPSIPLIPVDRPEIMDKFIRYLQFRQLDDLDDYAEELFVMAGKYAVDDLKAKCVESFGRTLNKDNIIKRLILAFTHSNAELLQLASTYLASPDKEGNFRSILKSDGWVEFMGQNKELAYKIVDAVFDAVYQRS